jgi:Fe-S cluster assembly protein SufD
MGPKYMKRKQTPLNDNLRQLLQDEPPLAFTGIPDWLVEERNMCRKRILENGLPAPGLEDWKYTDVSVIQSQDWLVPQQRPEETEIRLPVPDNCAEETIHLTILNGSLLPVDQTSVPDGINIRALSDPVNVDSIKPLLRRTNYRMESIFSVLNRALWHDGVSIHIQPETKASLHVHFVFEGHGRSSVLSAPRLFVHAGHHSQVDLTVSQWNRDKKASLGTANIDLDLDAGATMSYAHVQQLNHLSYQFTTSRINLDKDASIHALDASLGSALARHDLTMSLEAPGSNGVLNGIYLLRDKQTSDFHTKIEHRKPNCSSRQVYKGVLEDHAHAVFNGLVEVHPGASGTDGYQLNRTLLRSPHAVIDTKPELQILNDDVRCSHGATIGQIDPLQLFYLQSRAIPTELAITMLSKAFILDLVEQQPATYQQNIMYQSVEKYFTTS